MINPHGGKLVNQVLDSKQAQKVLDNINQYLSIELNEEQAKDVRNIAIGIYSPLTGFLKEKDFLGVVKNMRLANGTLWSVPVVLDIGKKEFEHIKGQNDIILSCNKNPIAIIQDLEVYEYDKDLIAENVYGTIDRAHPGVKQIDEMGEYLLGGEVKLLDEKTDLFSQYNLTPTETRRRFQMRGWQSVVAFQTRNVPHRGHEFLQKAALSRVDGLFIQPVIGKKKADDFRDEHIISSYELLIDKYYPKNKALLGILPLKMRYAGPREAVFHAIIRQNFGCTHFIVGRDHAGVKNFYDPFAAQEIFDSFGKYDLQIEIMKFPEVVFSKSRQEHCFTTDCPEDDRLQFSGSKLRDYIQNRELPPDHIIRPEIFHLLAKTKNLFVESMQEVRDKVIQKGFVLWFTGLSQAGKSTIANRVYEILKEQGVKIESLDGDIVRETLTKDLGFSKDDRDTNIRRVG
ncbi:sulfate adenylyltransferase, partial [Patescibacteria group bacterium]|nr:sulfate adenylyltransferase [Patescibacteria group bacterium]